MKIISIIFQGIAPLVLLIGTGIVIIYGWLSIRESIIQWKMLAAGLVLLVLGVLMIQFVQRHKQLSWFDALFGLFVWP